MEGGGDTIDKQANRHADWRKGKTNKISCHRVCVILSVDNKLFGFKHRGTLRSSSWAPLAPFSSVLSKRSGKPKSMRSIPSTCSFPIVAFEVVSSVGYRLTIATPLLFKVQRQALSFLCMPLFSKRWTGLSSWLCVCPRVVFQAPQYFRSNSITCQSGLPTPFSFEHFIVM